MTRLLLIIILKLIVKEDVSIKILYFVKYKLKLIININLLVKYLVSWLVAFLVKLALGVLRQRDKCLLDMVVKRMDLLEQELYSILFFIHYLSYFVLINFSTYHLLKVLGHPRLLIYMYCRLITLIKIRSTHGNPQLVNRRFKLFRHFFL